MKKEAIEKIREKLEKDRTVLEVELGKFAKKDTKPSGDWDTQYPKINGGGIEEEADEVMEYETLLQIEHNLESKIQKINSALEKIKNGKYGICEKCGKEINEDRLEAMPEANFCIKCQG